MDLRARVSALMPRARDELAELVSFRSVYLPGEAYATGCAQSADWVLRAFRDVGFADARPTETADGSTAVIGSRPGPDPAAPTVLLYAHHDVQPALDESAWRTPPFELTEVDGRWYGRGTADCKGNIVMHLTALRALDGDVPVNLKLVVEGSEEQGLGGLEAFVPEHADLLRADTILVCDTGNASVGHPAVTVSLRGMVNVVVRVEALESELHSGMFGGAAPDAMAALVAVLATLRDADGNTTVTGLDNTRRWTGAPYPPEQFRGDAGVLEGVSVVGDGTVSDMLWARPSLTILGIDCPPVAGSSAAISPAAAARLNLRIPPRDRPRAGAGRVGGTSPGSRAVGSAGVRGRRGDRRAVRGRHDRSGVRRDGSRDGGGVRHSDDHARAGWVDPTVQRARRHLPGRRAVLMGVEEPLCLIHAPNESVDPAEIKAMALTETLFLRHYRDEAPRRP